MNQKRDPYEKIERVSRRFEWLWRLIDRVRYGKPARQEVVEEYTTGE